MLRGLLYCAIACWIAQREREKRPYPSTNLISSLVWQAFLVETENKGVDFVGNRTECALLMLLREWGLSYKALRDTHQNSIERIYGFTSERKMASVLVRTPQSLRLYNKVSHPTTQVLVCP